MAEWFYLDKYLLNMKVRTRYKTFNSLSCMCCRRCFCLSHSMRLNHCRVSLSHTASTAKLWMRTEKGVNPSSERQINTSINCCRHLCTCNRKRQNEGGMESEGMGEWDTTTVCSRNIEIHMSLFDCREWEEKHTKQSNICDFVCPVLVRAASMRAKHVVLFSVQQTLSAHNSRNEIFARIPKGIEEME